MPSSLFRRGALRLKRWHEVMPLPKEIVVEPTTKCTLECQTCLHRNLTPERKDKDMPFEGFRKVLDGAPSLEQIVMSGLGEPLMNPEVFRMCTEAHLRGIRTKLVTNGMHISEEKAYEITFAFDFIEISFNIATIPAIDILLSEAPSLGVEGRLTVSVLGTPDNIRIYPAIQSMMAKKGIRCSLRELENWCAPGDQGHDELRRLVLEANRGRVKERFGRCPWPFNSAFVTNEGHVTPCTARMDPKRFSFGNAFEEPFWRIWDSEVYRSFRRGHLQLEAVELCSGCPAD